MHKLYYGFTISIAAADFQPKLDDHWSSMHKYRDYLISQIDAGNISAHLRQQNVLTGDQERAILGCSTAERRTETFLDVLELKPPEAYKTFLESISDIYPHVYLELTTEGDDDGKSA